MHTKEGGLGEGRKEAGRLRAEHRAGKQERNAWEAPHGTKQAPAATATQAGPPRHEGGAEGGGREESRPALPAPPRPAEPRSPGRGGRAPWARCCGGTNCGPAAPRWIGARTTTPSCPPSPSSTTRCAVGGEAGPRAGHRRGLRGRVWRLPGHGAPSAGGAEGLAEGLRQCPGGRGTRSDSQLCGFVSQAQKSGGLDRAASYERTACMSSCPVLARCCCPVVQV